MPGHRQEPQGASAETQFVRRFSQILKAHGIQKSLHSSLDFPDGPVHTFQWKGELIENRVFEKLLSEVSKRDIRFCLSDASGSVLCETVSLPPDNGTKPVMHLNRVVFPGPVPAIKTHSLSLADGKVR